MKLRGQLIQEEKKMTFPPFEMMAAALSKEGDIFGLVTGITERHGFPEE